MTSSPISRLCRRALALVAVALGAACSDASVPLPADPAFVPVFTEGRAATGPTRDVDPFIGSGGFGYAFGSAFAGAAAPQGMVKVGPDTSGALGTARFLHYSGYWYEDDTIQGFSHLHLHGTGATDYGILTAMPLEDFDASRTTPEGYGSPFAKLDEHAEPGFYGVRLGHGDIQVELTATAHAAVHRYTWPAGVAEGHVLFDLAHHLDGGVVDRAEVALSDEDGTLRGRLHHVGEMSSGFGGYDLFFAIRSRQPWTGLRVWADGAAPSEATRASGAGVGLVLTFDLSDHAPVVLDVGVSLVSEDGAAANLVAEDAAAPFEEVRARTRSAWDRLLSSVQVDGGTDEQRRTFSSALYRSFLMPTVQSDADGRYRGHDGAVATAEGFHYCTDMSLWDTYRTLHPLWAVIAPDRARDVVLSLDAMARASGGFPRWPIATGEAGTMLGASADVVIADTYLRGVTDFDAPGVYALLRAAALDPQAPPGGRGARAQGAEYLEQGWVAATTNRSVSMTTEYAQDDDALSRLAAALGEADDANRLAERARGYRQLFNPETGFLRPRNPDGTWTGETIDPLDFSGAYAEANAWQSLWAAPHDVPGLIELLGGPAAFVEVLEGFFEAARVELEQNPPSEPPNNIVPRPYYWAGNETDIHAPYLFALAGRPDLTQKWVAWARETFYGSGPDGLPGNDDGGTLSAWYVWSALGLYPLAGSDRYVLGAPLFPRAVVMLGDHPLAIEASRQSDGDIYVQSVSLDGVAVDDVLVRHSDLAAADTLRFELGPDPGP